MVFFDRSGVPEPDASALAFDDGSRLVVLDEREEDGLESFPVRLAFKRER